MTKQEAIDKMKKGFKVSHQYFTSNEWMRSDEYGLLYSFEDGVVCNKNMFWHDRSGSDWDTGWSIYND